MTGNGMLGDALAPHPFFTPCLALRTPRDQGFALRTPWVYPACTPTAGTPCKHALNLGIVHARLGAAAGAVANSWSAVSAFAPCDFTPRTPSARGSFHPHAQLAHPHPARGDESERCTSGSSIPCGAPCLMHTLRAHILLAHNLCVHTPACTAHGTIYTHRRRVWASSCARRTSAPVTPLLCPPPSTHQ